VKITGIIGVVLAVCLFVAVASPVLATAPSITTVAPDSGVQGNTYPTIVITGTDFTDATGADFGAGITVNGYAVDSATQITANITITAGAATGARDVAVTTPGGTGTLTGGFTVALATITVTAPTGFSLGYMTAGDTTTGTTTAGSVATNAQNWQVTAIDAKSTNAGYMTANADGTGAKLAALFLIGRTTGTVATSVTGFTYDETTNGDKNLPFFVSQTVASGDAGGAYTITITFTGSTP
jgi:hypothetical protein